MKDLIKIENTPSEPSLRDTAIGDAYVPTVNARELYNFLESKQQFSDWIKKRIEKLRLLENKDYILISEVYEIKNSRGGDRRSLHYAITLDVAKHIALMENTDRGFEVRDYFIECEKQLLAIDPETKILSKLLKSESNLETTLILKEYKEVVQAPLLEKVAEQQPKADFYDIAVASSSTVDIGEAAKILKYGGTGRNNLFKFLRREGVLMKNNAPKQEYVNKGWFKLVEYKVNGEVKIKTLVYQKGLDGIRKMLNEAGLLPEVR